MVRCILYQGQSKKQLLRSVKKQQEILAKREAEIRDLKEKCETVTDLQGIIRK